MEATQSEVAVDVRDLRMRYGDKDVLDGVSFTVKRGEVVTLLGPNGAGKTTTIEILEGFRLRSGGDVRVLDADPAHGDEAWRARTGVVLQSWRDHARWTPRQLLRLLGRYYLPYSTDEMVRPRDTEDLIRLVGLQDQADQKIRTLSGGQRRRLDVAVGIIGRPELLFLDEPTAGLDPHGKREFHELIHALVDLEDTTILLTTHDLAEAEKLADRILILAAGRIIADGSADALANEIEAKTEVRWTHKGKAHVHATSDATEYVRDLFRQHATGISNLEVRRASLEDTYIALVQKYESGYQTETPTALEEASR
ncbi:MAG: ABC transporter ATP-binding protein [Demequinaceae bacterium]|nr:ABC transporter ATP-binding protein [Demequinaceae bacterium]